MLTNRRYIPLFSAAFLYATGLALVATLEDWFDESRVRDDYVPTGFAGYGVRGPSKATNSA